MSYGARSMTAPLRRVLVRPPQPADVARWREYGWWLERAGADVVVYRGDEISREGDGDPTCLTRPLLRE